MLEEFPERCSDVHRSDIHGGVFVAHFYTAIYTRGATFHPRRWLIQHLLMMQNQEKMDNFTPDSAVHCQTKFGNNENQVYSPGKRA